MRSPSRVLAALAVLLPSAAAYGEDPCIHDGRALVHDKSCRRPIQDVVQLQRSSLYTAKIRCSDCPYLDFTGHGADTQRKLVHGDSDLFFNVSLSHNNRSVLVNDQPLFPSLHTIPHPPNLHVPQLPPAFSYTNLSHALTCLDPSCQSAMPECTEWCHVSRLGTVSIDYLYQVTHSPPNHTHPHMHYWTFALDALAGHDGYRDDPTWTFDNLSQQMLQITVAGTRVSQDPTNRDKDLQASSSLFGSFGASEDVYDLSIVDVQLVARIYDFVPKGPLTLWAKIRRFFGNDVWETQHRLVYLAHEWGSYGKKDSLRNMLGNFVHWRSWPLVWIILASVVGGLLTLTAMYRLFFWVVQQHELMKWDGMDDVWDKLRNHRDEQENALLDDDPYRDDPFEDGGSLPPRYTDDIDTMKPLPTKPLPEKPLPEVPLIDA